MYIFIREDLPISHQIVQSNHATFSIASLLRLERGIPNIILIGVPHLRSLNKVLAKLKAHQIPHFAWTEPDYDFGLTAIATAPLEGEQRSVLSNYRLYGGGPAKADCGSNPDSATMPGDVTSGVCLQ